MNAATAADLASGKGHKDENFPVASWLVKPEHRAPIMAFYRFARAADDISDNAAAPPHEKLGRLEAMRAGLTGWDDSEPTAAGLRKTIVSHGLDSTHALDLLEAFRRDVTKLRYESWNDLIGYCRVSAMPVGRFVLDVHGESRDTWPASDALCAALQVINHLQDCAEDYRNLNRVYLPQDMLAAAGARTEELASERASPALRGVIADCARRCDGLLAQSAGFSRMIRDRRLALEVAVIQRLAVSLTAKLKRRDPLSERVHHSKPEALALASLAAIGRIVGQ
ncbi:MAG: squalene synthase HpnC [Sphingomonadaceae bacterium]|nr:squalene synthase HpnC [Sphingomonadaceae bacterium]